jgi:hypothetical protein
MSIKRKGNAKAPPDSLDPFAGYDLPQDLQLSDAGSTPKRSAASARKPAATARREQWDARLFETGHVPSTL